MGILLAAVEPPPINPAQLSGLVSRPEAGAVSLFIGIVRNHDPLASQEVVGLHYSAHPSAADELRRIVAEALSERDPDDACAVAAVHRTGELVVGDTAFAVAVSAPHRALAFSVCEHIVERVKAGLPVWKQQFEADGSYRWSGLSG
jgi:molybdopterin synthase catalytic subunit